METRAMPDIASVEPVRDHDRDDREDDPGASSGEVISVALIHDSCLVREGIAVLLRRIPDFRVAQADSRGYVALLDEAEPDVVLLDLDLIHTDSIVIAGALKRNHPDVRVIVVDHIPPSEVVVELVEAGVRGFIHKDANVEQFLLTIRAVASGLDVLPDPLFDSLLSDVAWEAVTIVDGQDPSLARLTDRERDILDLIGQGSSNKAIGRRLHISIHTVKSHVRNIMEKLSLHSRLELASFVHRHSGEARPDGLAQ
jgi:two-component system, NarL family, nitrate/nitrite response regulator NarL